MKNSWEKNKFERKNKNNVFFNIIKYVIIFFISIMFVYNIVFIINKDLNNKKYIKIFNIFISTEKENVMEETIKKNSLLIGWKNNKDIKIGDIIGFDIDGDLRYHKVLNIYDDNGIKTYKTKADKNYNEDLEIKQKEDMKAKILFQIPILGGLFRILESKITTIIIIIMLVLKIILNNKLIELRKLRIEDESNKIKKIRKNKK